MIGFKIHRNIKQFYYVTNGIKLLIPDFIYRWLLLKRLNSLRNYDFEYIQSRVIYYIKLNHEKFSLLSKYVRFFFTISEFKL